MTIKIYDEQNLSSMLNISFTCRRRRFSIRVPHLPHSGGWLAFGAPASQIDEWSGHNSRRLGRAPGPVGSYDESPPGVDSFVSSADSHFEPQPHRLRLMAMTRGFHVSNPLRCNLTRGHTCSMGYIHRWSVESEKIFWIIYHAFISKDKICS